jgi:diacylglycerol kinase (ATP)
VAPSADPEDGLLDVLLVESASRIALAGVAARLRTVGVLANPHTYIHVGARIEIESDPPMPFNVDGELLGDVRHARFDAIPRALAVLVGPRYRRETAAWSAESP